MISVEGVNRRTGRSSPHGVRQSAWRSTCFRAGVVVVLVALVAPALAVPEGRSPDTLIVRFDDAARVRLRSGALVSLAGADLQAVQRILDRQGPRRIGRLLVSDEAEIDARRRAAEIRSGRKLPDLNSFFEIVVDPERSDALMTDLQGTPVIQTVYRAPLLVPPPVDIPPPTPDGEGDQLYLDPAPEGIDARFAWTRPGGRGVGIHIVDIEHSWRDNHEDLETSLGTQECYTPGTDYIEHGTAVLGVLVGGDNGYGVTGIANQSTVGLVTDAPVGMSYSVARAIECATSLMQPGDVLLLEAQTVGPYGNYVPVEYDPAEYDAIVVAAAAGIVVVEAAGNGGENLDDPAFGGLFDRSVRDSGAIIVGAGADLWYTTQPDRSRLDFSTYGSRVDVQAWGDDVVTSGYGDAFDGGGDPNQYYTEVFNGTSSASAMVAGAAAVLEGVQVACGGTPLSSVEVRDILVQTGSPQVNGPYPGHIGPRPDLMAALDLVEVDNDADGRGQRGRDVRRLGVPRPAGQDRVLMDGAGGSDLLRGGTVRRSGLRLRVREVADLRYVDPRRRGPDAGKRVLLPESSRGSERR